MNKVISIISIVIAVFSLCFTIYFSEKQPKTGYVLLNDIYENFDLSKELRQNFEALKIKRNMLLDSIKYNVTIAEKRQLKELEYYKQAYYYKSEEFQKSNQQVKDQYDEQIWKQVNKYIAEFGDEYDFKYIYGATGNGSLMYGKKDVDITVEVISYINKKYKGKR